MSSDPLGRICPNLLQDAEHDFFLSSSIPSNSTFASKYLSPSKLTSPKKNWIVHFLFLSQLSTQKPAIRNFSGDVEEGTGRTTNTCVIPRILSTCQSFHGSRAYSIHSFAQLSWHSTGETNLWTGRSRIPPFLTPCSTQSFLFKRVQE